jgi:hypothetical protein
MPSSSGCPIHSEARLTTGTASPIEATALPSARLIECEVDIGPQLAACRGAYRCRRLRQQHRNDQRHLDDRHGERQYERSVRLADPQRDHFGMVDGGNHIADQRRGRHQREPSRTDLADREPRRDAERGQDRDMKRNAADGGGGHAPL